MAKSVTITNGVGSATLVNDSYNITAEIPGYDNSTINPSTVNVVAGTDNYAFTISATGTLTLHVTEEGTTTGTPIVGATFIRTDASGNEYGTPITSDNSGNAIFENVAFAATDAPTIYYKQTASDGDHEFNDAVQSTQLTTATSTVEVQNTLAATRNITLTDANYENLPVDGTLTFNN